MLIGPLLSIISVLVISECVYIFIPEHFAHVKRMVRFLYAVKRKNYEVKVVEHYRPMAHHRSQPIAIIIDDMVIYRYNAPYRTKRNGTMDLQIIRGYTDDGLLKVIHDSSFNIIGTVAKEMNFGSYCYRFVYRKAQKRMEEILKPIEDLLEL